LTEANINYDGTRAIDGGDGEFRKGISTGVVNLEKGYQLEARP